MGITLDRSDIFMMLTPLSESTYIFLFVQIYLYVFQAYFKVSLSLWGFNDDILKSVYLGKCY